MTTRTKRPPPRLREVGRDTSKASVARYKDAADEVYSRIESLARRLHKKRPKLAPTIVVALREQANTILKESKP